MNLLQLVKNRLSNKAFNPYVLALVLLLVPVAVENIRGVWGSAVLPELCARDSVQDYAMVRAVFAGRNPYAPVPALVEAEVSECAGLNPIPYSHPSPHPIWMALVAHPFANFLNLETSYKLRIVTELLFLGLALCLLRKLCTPQISIFAIAAWCIPILASFRSVDTLYHGQVNFLLLLLYAAAAFTLKRAKDIPSGAFLGLAAAVKLASWPALLLLAAKKRWRIISGFLVLIITAQVASIAVLGFATFLNYLQNVVPTVARLYSTCGINESIWTLPRHLFLGYTERCFTVEDGSIVSALFPSQSLFNSISILLPIVIVLGFLWKALRVPRLEDGFLALASLSVIISPVVWGHAAVQTFVVIPVLHALGKKVWKIPTLAALTLFWISAILILPNLLPYAEENGFAYAAALRNILGLMTVLAASALILSASKHIVSDTER